MFAGKEGSSGNSPFQQMWQHTAGLDSSFNSRTLGSLGVDMAKKSKGFPDPPHVPSGFLYVRP